MQWSLSLSSPSHYSVRKLLPDTCYDFTKNHIFTLYPLLIFYSMKSFIFLALLFPLWPDATSMGWPNLKCNDHSLYLLHYILHPDEFEFDSYCHMLAMILRRTIFFCLYYCMHIIFIAWYTFVLSSYLWQDQWLSYLQNN